MIATIIIIFLLLVVGLLSYLLYISEKKLNTAVMYCEAYVRFINAVFFKVSDTKDRMKEIDRLGAFQADDEVGVIFKNLDECTTELFEFIKSYVNVADDETKENKKA
jgi:hypothetical protein